MTVHLNAYPVNLASGEGVTLLTLPQTMWVESCLGKKKTFSSHISSVLGLKAGTILTFQLLALGGSPSPRENVIQRIMCASKNNMCFFFFFYFFKLLLNQILGICRAG